MKKRKTHEGRNNVKRDNDTPVKILRHWKKEGGRNIVLPRKEILIRPDEMHRFLTRWYVNGKILFLIYTRNTYSWYNFNYKIFTITRFQYTYIILVFHDEWKVNVSNVCYSIDIFIRLLIVYQFYRDANYKCIEFI